MEQSLRLGGHNTPRRAVLLGIAGGAGLAVTGLPVGSVGANPPPTTADHFDFDTGNAAHEVLVHQAEPVILRHIAFNDATLVVRVTSLLQNAWFDAIAPYHPTAVGVYSRLGRRPSSEGVTNRNKNIAIMYASYRTLVNLIPSATADWRRIMLGVGLNPDDTQENKVTPIGIGNLAAKALINARVRDGMNQLGDEGGRKYNRLPYEDYLGYEPVNSAYELTNPSRWQPKRITSGNGIYRVQQFVTPQLRVTKPYSFRDPREFFIPPPQNSNHENRSGYRQQVDEVLAASAALNDTTKVQAEVFDDKFAALGISVGMAAEDAGLSLDEWIHLHMHTAVASFDVSIVVWHYKNLYDAVRPFTAIRYLYGGTKLTAWGGVGRGTVNDITGNEWEAYLPTADHPEYSSGSTGLYSAHAYVARRYLGTDSIDIELTRAAGSSNIEPGITPATDVVLRYTSWDDFARAGGMSRVIGGVHFRSAIEASLAVGPQVGERTYEFVERHIQGRA